MEDAERGPAAGEELPESPAGAGAGAEDLLENPVAEEEDDGSEGDDDGDGFSFPVAADACIVPVYPIFGRPPSPPPAGEEGEPGTATLRMPLGRLLLEEREFRARQKDRGSTATRARSAAAAEEEEDDDEAAGGGDVELEGVPPESYCLWAPGGQSSAPASPRQCRKSGSTGSVLRWRRISERLVGRSHSDGKEKFVFLNAPAAEPPPPPPHHKEEGDRVLSKKQGERVGSRKDGDGGGGGLGHPWSYQGGKGGGAGGRRRSYLPYKQELVGLFANVSGLRRSYHPF